MRNLIPQCHPDKKYFGKGLCAACWKRERKKEGPRNPDQACPIDGCGKLIDSNGYCQMHGARFRRYGDPLFVTPEEERVKNNRSAQPRLRKLKPTTYPKLFGRHEHRVVVEKHLGRKLDSDEVVHHIDGNRHNNKISNLQVMSQAEHARLHHGEPEYQHKARRRK